MASSLSNAPLTIGGLLRRQAQDNPDLEMLICDDDRLTFREAEERSRRLANGLLAAGVGVGTNVALLLPNGSEFVTAWLAAARIGAVSVPMSTFSTPSELRELLRGSNTAVLIMKDSYRSHDYLDALKEAVPSLDLSEPGLYFLAEAPCLRQVYVSGAPSAIPAKARLEALVRESAEVRADVFEQIEEAVRPSDRMVIVYTSGSTASPKGVMHTHGGMIRNLSNLNRLRGLARGSRLFSNSPMFWIGGLAYNLVGVLAAGATLICSNAEDPAKTMDLIERERPQLVNGYAQTIAHLTRHPSFPDRDFSSIRRGNLYPIMPEDVRPVDPELRHNLLGSTEAGSVCLMESDESDLPETLRGSFGRPVPDLEAQIVDPVTGSDCPVDTVGELWLRGPMLMEGYYGLERFETFTADGWFRTGDMFIRNGEGFYFFKGRRGDMIKTAGANVAPREVEGAISEVTGGISSIVFGLSDPERGQIVAAVILSDREINMNGLDEALRSRLSHYKVPRKIVRLDPSRVPVRSSGKPDLVRLATMIREID